MKYLIVMLLAIGTLSFTNSIETKLQGKDYSENVKDGDLTKHPEFKGGQEALIEFMSENVNYPEEAKKNNIEGKPVIGFTIQADAKVKKSVNKLLDKEALRVINLMPNWVPGEKSGATIKTELALPVAFKINTNE